MMLTLGVILGSLVMHPSQETFAEMQFNEKTGRVEVSLRLSLLDEQRLLRPKRKFPNPEVVVLVENFRFGREEALDEWPTDAKTMKSMQDSYQWIGRQDEGAHVWWHFEHQPQSKMQATHVRCRFFDNERDANERDDDIQHSHEHAVAVHRFNVLTHEGVRSYTSTSFRPIVRLDW